MSEERGDAMKLVVTERGVEAARPLRGVDHVLVGVRNLEAARDTYRRLGFTVSPRGRHLGWGTANYCIMFPGASIELLGILDPTPFPNNLTPFPANPTGPAGVP